MCLSGPTLRASLAASGSVDPRHGLIDQEAPQTHAQEEAQEAAEEDPLATPSAGQVGSGRPAGAAVSRCRARVQGSSSTPARTVDASHTEPETAAATRTRARSASATFANTTVYDEPLPARIAGAPAADSIRRLNSTRRGSTCSAAT